MNPVLHFTLFIAKSSNRFSSDTDNETDRLLGVQRSDPMKLVNNSSDTTALPTPNATNINHCTDLQLINDSPIKPHSSNSREGKISFYDLIS